MDAFKPVRDFEAALCAYTGAPYAVAVNSCSMALLLAVAWHLREQKMSLHGEPFPMPISIPNRTYLSVPMSIIHAGGRPTFRDEDWTGAYQLKPLPVWDSARLFTSGMYTEKKFVPERRPLPPRFSCESWYSQHAMVCVSFHHSKTLGDTQGGAILHDNPEADAWLRRARFDGRTEGVPPAEDNAILGWHCYLSPDVAARLSWKLSKLPAHNAPLPNDNYPDLSKMDIFK